LNLQVLTECLDFTGRGNERRFGQPRAGMVFRSLLFWSKIPLSYQIDVLDKNGPEGKHAGLAPIASTDKAVTGLANNLANVLGCTPAAENAGCEVSLTLCIGFCGEHGDEGLVGDNVAAHATRLSVDERRRVVQRYTDESW